MKVPGPAPLARIGASCRAARKAGRVMRKALLLRFKKKLLIDFNL
jgi:hypothetical protein